LGLYQHKKGVEIVTQQQQIKQNSRSQQHQSNNKATHPQTAHQTWCCGVCKNNLQTRENNNNAKQQATE